MLTAIKLFFNKYGKNILILIILISIIFRIFSILVVPEPAYNDAVYHLELAKDFMDGAAITKETPPFGYHLILAGFYSATNFPMEWPFVKIVPLILFLAQAAIVFLLFRKVFPKYFEIPLIFFISFPWAVRIGSVNMVDSFAVFAVLLATYAIYSFMTEKKQQNQKWWIFLACISFVLIAFSKMNALFVSPALLLLFIFLLWKKIGWKKAILKKS